MDCEETWLFIYRRIHTLRLIHMLQAPADKCLCKHAGLSTYTTIWAPIHGRVLHEHTHMCVCAHAITVGKRLCTCARARACLSARESTHVCAHAQTYSDACTAHFLQAPSSTHSRARFGRLHTCMCANTHMGPLRRHFSTPTHTRVHRHACLRTQMSGRAYAHRRALREHIHMCAHTYKFARAPTKVCRLTRMSPCAALYASISTCPDSHTHLPRTYTKRCLR